MNVSLAARETLLLRADIPHGFVGALRLAFLPFWAMSLRSVDDVMAEIAHVAGESHRLRGSGGAGNGDQTESRKRVQRALHVSGYIALLGAGCLLIGPRVSIVLSGIGICLICVSTVIGLRAISSRRRASKLEDDR